MKAWFALLFAAVVVIAGVMPVLYCVALLAWQVSVLAQTGSWVALPATLLFSDHALLQGGKAARVLAFIPQWPWAAHDTVTWILGRVHVGLVPALVGLAVMALGMLGVLRQRAAIRAGKQRDEDRLRRVRDYRREEDASDGRREPFIGSGDIARDAERRVA